MPKMEAIISVRYRVPLDTDVPDAEFKEIEPPEGLRRDDKAKAEVMTNEQAVEKARRQAAKDANSIAKELKQGQDDVLDVLVEEVRDA